MIWLGDGFQWALYGVICCVVQFLFVIPVPKTNKQTHSLAHSHLGKELSQGNEEDFMPQHKTTIRTKCVAFCPTFKADNCIEVGGGGILTEGINDEVNE